MEQRHRDILRSNRMLLVQNVNAEKTVDCLVESGIFTNDDKNVILSEGSSTRMNEKLLDLLPRRGSRSFHCFVDALSKLGLSRLGSVLSVATESEGLDTLDGPVRNSSKTEDEDDEDEDGRLGLLSSLRSKTKSCPLPSNFVEVNIASVMDPNECYPMDSAKRGLLVLVNNKKFERSSGMQDYPRNGTDIDAKSMTNLFEDLGFVVQTHKNLTVYEMRKVFKQAAVRDYSNLSALAVCVLSHGQEGIIYGIDDTMDIRELCGYFRGRNLAGKPKMFFFQACQGSEYMDAVEPDCAGREETDGPPEYGNDISLPTEADFIYAYSTVPGYYSWRNSAKGSWFIQAIVEVFRKYSHKMEVVRMLTRVNNIVSTKKSQTGQFQSHHKRQVSSIVSQLRKDLFLCPPDGPLKTYSVDY